MDDQDSDEQLYAAWVRGDARAGRDLVARRRRRALARSPAIVKRRRLDHEAGGRDRDAIGERLRALKVAATGDKIVMTAGLPKLGLGSTNTIKVHNL